MPKKKTDVKFDFEKALKELDGIVRELETGELSLDESLARYEKGVKLSEQCQSKLDQAREKVKKLIKKQDGTFEKEDFDLVEDK